MGAPRILAPTTISGGIPTAGAGTLNTVALWTPDGFTLGNSLLTQSGSVITNATGAIRANGTTQSTPAFMRYDATTSGIYFPATNEIGFTISSQHAMFISSGRFVGIGTTTPGYRLHVKDATNRNMIMTSGTTGMKITSLTDAGAEADIGVQGNTVQVLTGGTERARIDSSGNFGLGVTPSAWGNGVAMQGVGWTISTGSGYDQSLFTTNARQTAYSGTGNFVYRGAGPASAALYAQGNGHLFYVAPAGVGGAAIAWTPALEINGTGNVTTAFDVTMYGVRVGRGAGSVSSNTAVGSGALGVNTTGLQNTALGFNALAAVASGQNNTGLGFGAMVVATGSNNTAVGAGASNNQTTGANNTSVGHQAGWACTTSSNNTSVGQNAALYQTGANNVAVGMSAMLGTLGSSTATNNVSVGTQAGQSVTTGGNNVFVGHVAGSGVTTGTSNTMIGYATASGGTTTGTDNTLVGAIAGNQITTGSNNVCVGSNAGQTQTTASDNTYVGKNAGYFQLGSTNTAVGRSAMTGASGGASTNTASTAVGYLALQNVTSGNANTAIGSEAGNALTSNGENTFVGQQAGYFPTNGENTAIGRVAMRGISGSSTGSANTALGRAALYSFTTGIQNTALGRNAAFALSSGNNNVLIGERAAETLTTGSANIVIGRLATTAAATDSNQLVLGSATDFVATNGGATTYYATAGASLGYIQVRLNGANVKIQVFAP